MSATEAGAAMSPNRIDFIDKNDAGRVLFALFEKISNSGSADTDKHFNKIGTADAEKRNFASPAMARANNVLPVPGGPMSRHPFGILPPSLMNFCGSLRNSIISCNSS